MENYNAVLELAEAARWYIEQEKDTDDPLEELPHHSFDRAFKEYNKFFKRPNRIKLSMVPRYIPPQELLAA